MRTNLATVTLSSEAPAETYAADAGQSRHPNSEALDAPDTTIVVIEKRSLVRECLASCLASQSGNRVVTFPTVDAYLDAAHANPSSLVLLGESTSPGSTVARPGSVDAPLATTIGCGPGGWRGPAANSRSDRLRRAWLYSNQPQTGGGRGGASARASRRCVRARHQCDDCAAAPLQRGRCFSRRA